MVNSGEVRHYSTRRGEQWWWGWGGGGGGRSATTAQGVGRHDRGRECVRRGRGGVDDKTENSQNHEKEKNEIYPKYGQPL